MLLEVINIIIHLFQCIVCYGERRAGSILDSSLAHVFYHGILNHLGINAEYRHVRVLSQCLQYSIGSYAHSALQRQELRRNMSLLQVTDQKISHIMSHLFGHRVERFEGTRLLRNVAFYHTHNLAGINLHILFTYSIAHIQDWDRCAEWAFCYLIYIVKITGSWTVEGILLDEHLLCQSNDGRNDAAGRGKECLAGSFAFFQIRNFDDGKVYIAIEATAQALSHVAEVHILIINLAQVGMSSKVLVGRKWRTELDGMGCCHVTFDTLRGRSTREDAHLERSARLVLSHGSLGEFAEGCLRHAVWCETTQSDCILIVNHRCRFGSTQSCICHFLLT